MPDNQGVYFILMGTRYIFFDARQSRLQLELVKVVIHINDKLQLITWQLGSVTALYDSARIQVYCIIFYFLNHHIIVVVLRRHLLFGAVAKEYLYKLTMLLPTDKAIPT